MKAYRHEQCSTDNPSLNLYVGTQDKYTTAESGFGLFNTFVASTALTVSEASVSGSVFSDYYSESTGEIYSDYGGVAIWSRRYGATISVSKRLSCGLFAGRKDDANLLTLNGSTIKINTSGDGIHSGKEQRRFYWIG